MNKTLSFSILNNPGLAGIMIILIFFTGLVSGSYPAFFLSHIQPSQVLKNRLKLKGRKINLKNILLSFQFIISIFLITITIMVYQQVNFMNNKSLGFQPGNLVTIGLPQGENFNPEWRLSFINQVEQHPGITKTSFSQNIPGTAPTVEAWGMTVETDQGKEESLLRIIMADPSFLDIFNIDLVDGRNFDHNLETDLNNSIIVNEALVRKFNWKEPIGKTITRHEVTRRVIGVVSDFNYQSLYQPIEPMVIIPIRTGRIITAKIDPGQTQNAINHMEEVFNLNIPGYPFEYRFIDQSIANTYEEEENTAKLLGIFSFLSIFISLVGLFGLSGFTAEQKTKEIGIRKTYGATTIDIIKLLFEDFATFVLVSLLVAFPFAYLYMERWLANFAFRINVTIWPFIIALTIAVFISYLTVAYHAIKSSGANPAKALKYE